MKALKYILLYCAVLLSAQMHAQNTIFLAEGKIEFEKKLRQVARIGAFVHCRQRRLGRIGNHG